MAEVDVAGGRSSRAYDVVIFGASGFTGKYVVREALKFLNAPNSPLKSLALAGRSPSRLAEALKWAAGPNPPPKVPLLTADTSDAESLARVASQARIVLDCVGPFRLYGQPVVAACVKAGCDYLDICGEPDFMERMEAKYHGEAAEKGSLVISACGFDSVPAEIGLLFHSKHWAGPSAPNRVEAYLSLESGPTNRRFSGWRTPISWRSCGGPGREGPGPRFLDLDLRKAPSSNIRSSSTSGLYGCHQQTPLSYEEHNLC